MQTMALNRPVVLFMIGYPGSGKSSFARQLSENAPLVHLSDNRIRFELYETPEYTKEENAIVLRIMDYMYAEYLKQGMSVVFDAPLNRNQRRERREMARRAGYDNLTIFVQTDLDTSFDRATNRDRRATDDKYTPTMSHELFETLRSRVKRPQHEEYVVISGKHVFRNQFHVFKRKLEKQDLVRDKTVAEIAEAGPAKPSVKRPMLGGRIDFQRRNRNRRIG